MGLRPEPIRQGQGYALCSLSEDSSLRCGESYTHSHHLPPQSLPTPGALCQSNKACAKVRLSAGSWLMGHSLQLQLLSSGHPKQNYKLRRSHMSRRPTDLATEGEVLHSSRVGINERFLRCRAPGSAGVSVGKAAPASRSCSSPTAQ